MRAAIFFCALLALASPAPVVVLSGTPTFSLGSKTISTPLKLSMQQDWSYIMTANCTACPVRTYDYSQSTTFNATVEYPVSSITLGPDSYSPVTLSGFVGADRLCFS